MDSTYEEQCFEVEDFYWGFAAKKDLISRLLNNLDLSPDAMILDMGFGGGYILRLLRSRQMKNVFGIDASAEAVKRCRAAGIENVSQQDFSKTGFKDATFDLLIAADVLEHMPDEAAALNEVKRLLKPGGRALFIVPAFNFLWLDAHDKIVGHYRRYSKGRLKQVLRQSGFTVDKVAYWELLIFFPMLLYVSWRKIISRPGAHIEHLNAMPTFTNTFLGTLLKLENSISSWWGAPIGISVYALVEKK